MCAVLLGNILFLLLPVPPHFFALAQRNGVEPQRNALLGAATGAVRSRPPLPRTRSPNITADCVKLTLPGRLTNRLQINLTHQFVPLGLRAEWERRAGPPSSCGGFKALFFGGSTPFLWASTKEMGSNRRTSHRPPPNVSAHTYKPTDPHHPPPKVGRETSRLPTCSAHANGGAAGVKKRLSLAARHRFFGQAPKKWGRIAGQAIDHHPTYRRTRTNPRVK